MARVGFRALLLLACVVGATFFTAIAVRQVTSPRVLDPIETATLDQAERIWRGDPLYLEPTSTAQASLMPGFPFAVSLLVQAFGPQLWEVRAVALAATLVVALLVLFIVRLESASWTLALTGGSFALVAQGLLAGPPGTARPESVMLLWATLGFLALRLTNGVLGAILAALLVSLAFFVDAQAAWFAAALICCLGLDDTKRLGAFVLTAAIGIGGGYLALSQLLGSWFNFYVWDVPFQAIRLNPPGVVQFVCDHVLGKLGLWTLAAVLSFAMPVEPWCGKGGLWMWMAFAALMSGLAATQSMAFSKGALVPSIVVLALLGTISMHRIARHLSAWPGADRLEGDGAALAAVALQLVALFSSMPVSRWHLDSLAWPWSS